MKYLWAALASLIVFLAISLPLWDWMELHSWEHWEQVLFLIGLAWGIQSMFYHTVDNDC